MSNYSDYSNIPHEDSFNVERKPPDTVENGGLKGHKITSDESDKSSLENKNLDELFDIAFENLRKEVNIDQKLLGLGKLLTLLQNAKKDQSILSPTFQRLSMSILVERLSTETSLLNKHNLTPQQKGDKISVLKERINRLTNIINKIQLDENVKSDLVQNLKKSSEQLHKSEVKHKFTNLSNLIHSKKGKIVKDEKGNYFEGKRNFFTLSSKIGVSINAKDVVGDIINIHKEFTKLEDHELKAALSQLESINRGDRNINSWLKHALKNNPKLKKELGNTVDLMQKELEKRNSQNSKTVRLDLPNKEPNPLDEKSIDSSVKINKSIEKKEKTLNGLGKVFDSLARSHSKKLYCTDLTADSIKFDSKNKKFDITRLHLEKFDPIDKQYDEEFDQKINEKERIKNNIKELTLSSNYTQILDLEKLNLVNDGDTYSTMREKIDVFRLGVSLFVAITGEFPHKSITTIDKTYSDDEDEKKELNELFINEDGNSKDLQFINEIDEHFIRSKLKEHLPQKQAEKLDLLICDMLKPDLFSRPTSQEAYERFKKI